MLNTINLENFKGFNSLRDLKIKPITILAGTNSCGKSTILQSLLLLKQSVESKNINQTLLLNGRFVHLGTFENIIFKKDIQNSVKLGVCFNIKKEDLSKNFKGNIPLHYILRDLISEKSFDIPKAEYRFHYSISLKAIEKEKNRRRAYLKPITVEKIEFFVTVQEPSGKNFTETIINMSIKEDDLYTVEWSSLNTRFFGREKKNDNRRKGTETFKITFANLFPVSFEANNKDVNYTDIQYTFYMLNDLFRQVFSSITYIGPLREEPSRRYIYEDEIVEIGVKGENAAYIFLSEQENKISNQFFLNDSQTQFIKEPKEITLFDSMNRWNDLMKIKNFKAENLNEIIQLNLDSASGSEIRVNIADVGFGVSQIFPIILEGIRMIDGGTLVLEQPEIHLHPNLQMQLADYFIALALSGKNVIVETHSDHIVNRIIRRIIEDDKYGLNNLISMYFIEPSSNGSTYSEIEVDENRGIVNWPSEFFDQAASEQEKIIRAAINKRKKK